MQETRALLPRPHRPSRHGTFLPTVFSQTERQRSIQHLTVLRCADGLLIRLFENTKADGACCLISLLYIVS